jgi:tetratricopeptide (TPR) repeat protein
MASARTPTNWIVELRGIIRQAPDVGGHAERRIAGRVSGLLGLICLILLLVPAGPAAGSAIPITVHPDLPEISLSTGPQKVVLRAEPPGDMDPATARYRWTLHGPGRLVGPTDGPEVDYLPPAELPGSSAEVTITVSLGEPEESSRTGSQTLRLVAPDDQTAAGEASEPEDPAEAGPRRRSPSPDGDDPFSAYRAVLDETPDDPAARQGLARLMDRTAREAASAFARADYETARRGYEAALTVAEYRRRRLDDPAMAEPVGRFRGRLREIDSITRPLSEILAQAEARFREGRFTGPGTDNALAQYENVLRLDPAHPTARQRLGQMLKRSKTQGDRALSAGDPEGAVHHYEAYTAIAETAFGLPDPPDVADNRMAVEKQLTEARHAVRIQRLESLKARFAHHLTSYEALKARENAGEAVNAEIIRTLDQIIETLKGLQTIYRDLSAAGPDVSDKLERLHRTRVRLEREQGIRVERMEE